jgi:hypothetical protein
MNALSRRPTSRRWRSVGHPGRAHRGCSGEQADRQGCPGQGGREGLKVMQDAGYYEGSLAAERPMSAAQAGMSRKMDARSPGPSGSSSHAHEARGRGGSIPCR